MSTSGLGVQRFVATFAQLATPKQEANSRSKKLIADTAPIVAISYNGQCGQFSIQGQFRDAPLKPAEVCNFSQNRDVKHGVQSFAMRPCSQKRRRKNEEGTAIKRAAILAP
jgi:hypothetical protein